MRHQQIWGGICVPPVYLSIYYDGMVKIMILENLRTGRTWRLDPLTMRTNSNVPSPWGRNSGRQCEDNVKYSQSSPREWPFAWHCDQIIVDAVKTRAYLGGLCLQSHIRYYGNLRISEKFNCSVLICTGIQSLWLATIFLPCLIHTPQLLPFQTRHPSVRVDKTWQPMITQNVSLLDFFAFREPDSWHCMMSSIPGSVAGRNQLERPGARSPWEYKDATHMRSIGVLLHSAPARIDGRMVSPCPHGSIEHYCPLDPFEYIAPATTQECEDGISHVSR